MRDGDKLAALRHPLTPHFPSDGPKKAIQWMSLLGLEHWNRLEKYAVVAELTCQLITEVLSDKHFVIGSKVQSGVAPSGVFQVKVSDSGEDNSGEDSSGEDSSGKDNRFSYYFVDAARGGKKTQQHSLLEDVQRLESESAFNEWSEWLEQAKELDDSERLERFQGDHWKPLIERLEVPEEGGGGRAPARPPSIHPAVRPSHKYAQLSIAPCPTERNEQASRADTATGKKGHYPTNCRLYLPW